MDWVYLAKVRVQWLALVKKVMNYRVRKTVYIVVFLLLSDWKLLREDSSNASCFANGLFF